MNASFKRHLTWSSRAAALSAVVACGCGGEDEVPVMSASKLLIEHNGTDHDTGFQGFVDGDPWGSLALTGPGGAVVLEASPQGRLADFGFTELFFETAEPPNDEVAIDDVKARLAEGAYTATGDMVGDGASARSTALSHAIPTAPVITAPAADATGLDASQVGVSWSAVTQDLEGGALDVVAYQVIVEEDAPPAFPNGFARPVMSVHLAASATSVAVPSGFLRDDACYKLEVLAIERTGNQTLSSRAFETGAGCAPPTTGEDETPRLKEAKLLIEHNATDEDTGFQGFADGDPWRALTIRGPDGAAIASFTPGAGLSDFGLTELFFETSEPENAEVPIAQVLARLPEGAYAFTADIIGGQASSGTATFTHVIPAGPVLVSPRDGAEDVDPAATRIAWQPVTRDLAGQAVEVVGYQVIVEEDVEPAPFPDAFAAAVFSIYLPASASEIGVPAAFMRPGTAYKYEVLAIEVSGNQTLSSAAFETR